MRKYIYKILTTFSIITLLSCNQISYAIAENPKLPHELQSMISGNLEPENLFNILTLSKGLNPIVQKALFDKLQERGPLKVTPSLLPKLVPFKDWVRRIRLISKQEDPVTDDTLKNVAKIFPDLTELDLTSTNITDISSLKHLTKLTTLNLSGTKVAGKALRYLPKSLTTLDLSYTKITTLSGIEGLTSLTILHLIGCVELTDLSGLKDLTNLTKLNLGYTNIINSDLQYIPRSVTTLDLPGCNNLTDLFGLKDLTNLTKLNLSSCWHITVLFYLKTLPNLQILVPSKGRALSGEELREYLNSL